MSHPDWARDSALCHKAEETYTSTNTNQRNTILVKEK